MPRQQPFCKITIEFPATNEKHYVALFYGIKRRVFDWRYNGSMRGEITPTRLVKRLMKWIGDYDPVTAGVKYKSGATR
jgi:hypothetical protein